MKFTEAKLEQAIIELLGEQGYPPLNCIALRLDSSEDYLREF